MIAGTTPARRILGGKAIGELTSSLLKAMEVSSRPYSETSSKGITHGLPRILDSSDSTSSSSSGSSCYDLVPVSPQVVPKFRAPNNIPKPKPLYKNEKYDMSTEALYRLEESTVDSPESTSHFSDITHESLISYISPLLSPPIQVMERPGDFDPNRIPASIFSKPSTPTEWSIASNESLFSIGIGDSSFSKDHVSRTIVDLYRSGELPISQELLKSDELCHPEEVCDDSREPYQSEEIYQVDDLKGFNGSMSFRQTFPIAKGVEPNQDPDMDKILGEDILQGTQIVDEPINDVDKVPVNNVMKTNIGESMDSCGANHQPNKIKTNFLLIAVPRKRKSSRYCCKAWCCCTWSSCSYKPTSCSCFKCPSCSCKWLRWLSCSRAASA